MWAIVIGLLTVIMVLDCVVLIFLVLIQLPKKEAGAGLAFGAGATDALFGAGSGTVLTKITKYAAATFFGMAILLSIMQSSYHSRHISQFEKNLGKTPASATLPPAGSPGPATAPQQTPMVAPLVTNSVPLTNLQPTIPNSSTPGPTNIPLNNPTPAEAPAPAAPPK